MKYSIDVDINYVCKILDFSYSSLAKELGVARSTITRIVNKEVYPSDLFLESFYSYAYENHSHPIKINNLKTQFAIDEYNHIMFHGARFPLDGDIDLNHSRTNVDLGVGFYLGESYEQAASYVFAYNKASVYIFDTSKLKKLKIKELSVSLEWMLVVSYYRGQLEAYKDHKIIKNIINEIEQYDVIVAPIADNNMYEIMNQFARGDITDEQAIHALSASNLGKQHVLKTLKACKSVKIISHLYLSKPEKKDIEVERMKNALIAADKIKLSIEAYRRKGKYIEEILK